MESQKALDVGHWLECEMRGRKYASVRPVVVQSAICVVMNYNNIMYNYDGFIA